MMRSEIQVRLCYLVVVYCSDVFSPQAVCEEIRRLAHSVGLHHDGVVFGSDDFCASIGNCYFLNSTFSLATLSRFKRVILNHKLLKWGVGFCLGW